MTYQYVAVNTRGEVIKGKLSAVNEEAAGEMLSFAGFQVINLKPYVPFISIEKLGLTSGKIKSSEIILFFRQLAMLIESGMNIAVSIELLQMQSGNRQLKKVLGDIGTNIRGGTQLSDAMLKYPKVFPTVYCQLIGVGENSGDLESVLRQVADYMEKEIAAVKATKSALMMPGITMVVAVIVVILLIVFVLPSFVGMYSSLGAKLPAIVDYMIGFGNFIKNDFIYVGVGIVAVVLFSYLYIRTPRGKFLWDRMLLALPFLGRIRLLSELARYCRSMALLFRSGMPLTEVMPMLIRSSSNKALSDALSDVQTEMLKGEGLSRPMSKNKLFLPMMVQMIKVGEETGNLESTLLAVADSYEAEAEDKINAFIALLPPVMTIIIGAVVGLIAVTLMSAMTSMYGQAF